MQAPPAAVTIRLADFDSAPFKFAHLSKTADNPFLVIYLLVTVLAPFNRRISAAQSMAAPCRPRSHSLTGPRGLASGADSCLYQGINCNIQQKSGQDGRAWREEKSMG